MYCMQFYRASNAVYNYKHVTTMKLLTWRGSSLIQTINRKNLRMRNERTATIIWTVMPKFPNQFAATFCIEVSLYTLNNSSLNMPRAAISRSVLLCHPISVYWCLLNCCCLSTDTLSPNISYCSILLHTSVYNCIMFVTHSYFFNSHL
jgi:hypothetical protein